MEAGPSQPTLGGKHGRNAQKEPETPEVFRAGAEQNKFTAKIIIEQTMGKTANIAHTIEAGGPSASGLSFQRRHSTAPVFNAMLSPALPGKTASISLSSLKPAEVNEQKPRDKNLNTNFKNSSGDNPQQNQKVNNDAKLSALSSAHDEATFKKPLLPASSIRGASELTVWKRNSLMGPPQPLHRQRSRIQLEGDLDSAEIISTRKLSRSVSPDTLAVPAKPAAREIQPPRAPSQARASHRRTQTEYGHNMNALDSSRAREQNGYPHPRGEFISPGRGNNETLSPLGNYTVKRPQENFTSQQRRIVSDNHSGRYTPSSGHAYDRDSLDERAHHRRQSYHWSGRYDDRHRG